MVTFKKGKIHNKGNSTVQQKEKKTKDKKSKIKNIGRNFKELLYHFEMLLLL